MPAMNAFFDRHRLRMFAGAALLALCAPLAAAAQPATAASTAPAPAWQRAKFGYVAQRQDLRQVLRDFARAMRVQLDLADEVMGSVTGSFDMAPPVLLDMLGSFHQFVWHYDGAVLYVSSSRPGAPKMRLRATPAATVAAASAVASPAAAAAAAPAPKPAPSWAVKLEDGTLSKTFARWARDAGWQLLWEMPVDFRIDANTRVEGEFEQAVTAVAESLAGAETPMQVVLYRGNHVIRVTSKGNQ